MHSIPDDLSVLLSQLTITPSSPSISPSSSPSNDSPQQEYMTAHQRLLKLQEMRTSLQQRLLLVLVKVPHVNSATRKDVESQLEELRDLLDGMDLLIQKLSRGDHGGDGGDGGKELRDDSAEEWRGAYEL